MIKRLLHIFGKHDWVAKDDGSWSDTVITERATTITFVNVGMTEYYCSICLEYK